MSEGSAFPEGETGFDQVLTFSIAARHARGRIIRLGPVLETILSAHDYPSVIRDVLAEALVLAALMGSLLKDDGSQLTMQAQSEGGIIDLLVCDYRDGELRGYVRHDAERLAELGANPSLFALFGKGFLGVTFDLAATRQRYQGIVPLEGESLAAACEAYFGQSEQVPTLIRVGLSGSRKGCVAGGMIVQHLAEGEEGRERLHVRLDHPEWEHVAALGGSLGSRELTDQTLSLEQIVWRLFHEEEEVRVDAGRSLSRGCRCDESHYHDVLSRFPEEERVSMRDEKGVIVIDCAFCSKLFNILI